MPSGADAGSRVRRDSSDGRSGAARSPARAERGIPARWATAAVVALAVALGLAGCGDDDGPATDGVADADLSVGEEVYTQNCATCHGGAGEGATAPPLADGAVVERYPNVEDHRDVVVDGTGAMPAFGGRLSDEEIDAVVRYEREGLGSGDD